MNPSHSHQPLDVASTIAAAVAYVTSRDGEADFVAVCGYAPTVNELGSVAASIDPLVRRHENELVGNVALVVRRALLAYLQQHRRGRRASGPFVAVSRTVPLVSRFCTPSILPGHITHSVLDSETSISMGEFGSLAANSGAFRDTHDALARLHGADAAFISVNGSSGANQSILYWIAMHWTAPRLAIGRTAHKGVILAADAFNLDWRYIGNDGYNGEFEAFLPLTPEALREALTTDPSITHVLFNSVTYEGLVADLEGLCAVRDEIAPHVVLIADEAWGAHFAFTKRLAPRRAMAHGIDVANLSVHKQGGSLQGGALLLIRRSERFDERELLEACGHWATTSPNFTIVASIEAATMLLASEGERLIEQSIAQAQQFEHELVTLVGDLRFAHQHLTATNGVIDPLKVTFSLRTFALNGFELADALSARGVVVEKEGLNAITFLFPFQLRDADVTRGVQETAALLAANRATDTRPFAPDPTASIPERRALTRHERVATERVLLADAVGRRSAGLVAAYPPGIPIVCPGDEITAEQTRYLEEILAAGGKLIPRNEPTLPVVTNS